MLVLVYHSSENFQTTTKTKLPYSPISIVFFLFQATSLQLRIFVVVKYMHHEDDLVEHRIHEACFGAHCTNHSANSMCSNQYSLCMRTEKSLVQHSTVHPSPRSGRFLCHVFPGLLRQLSKKCRTAQKNTPNPNGTKICQTTLRSVYTKCDFSPICCRTKFHQIFDVNS